jgi:hypothetical protein
MVLVFLTLPDYSGFNYNCKKNMKVKNMSNCNQLRAFVGAISIATSLIVLPSQGWAGFTWTAPVATQAQQGQAVMPSVTAAPVVRAPVMPSAPAYSVPRTAVPQQMPQQMLQQQAAPQMMAPDIVFEPMGMGQVRSQPSSSSAVMPVPRASNNSPSFAPTAPVTNSMPAPITAPDIAFGQTPAMMPGASVVPQQSATASVAEPVSRPMPVAQTMSVENGMNQAQPRRIRPDLSPQRLVPGAPMGGGMSPQYNGRVDFVPAATPGSIGALASMGSVDPRSVNSVQMQPIIDATTSQVAATPVFPKNVFPAPMSSSMPPPMNASQAMPFSMNGTPGMYEDAVGFGKDLPLMIAVKQIVPESFGISIAPGVGDGSNVSWQGGRPWNEALDLALAPQGLQSSVSGNVVTVMPMAASIPAPTPQYQTISGALPSGQVFNASPVFDDSSVSSGAPMFAPSPLLQNASTPMAPSSSDNLFTPVSAVGGGGQSLPQQPMIGSMESLGSEGSFGSVGAPVQPMNPQMYDSAVQFWAAPKDSSLREVLTSWTRKAGVELFWSSQYDYPISAAVNVEGDFEEAVQILLRGLEESDPRPLGRLHPNLPNGPAVLVIEARGAPN